MLSKLITSHRSKCKPRITFNKLQITSGWGFHNSVIIKYIDGRNNKFENLLSRAHPYNIKSLGSLMCMDPLPMMHTYIHTQNRSSIFFSIAARENSCRIR